MHTCLPNQNAKTFDRANKEGDTGGQERGERGGRREKRRGRTGGREKRGREKGTPLNKHIIRNGPTWEGFMLNNKLGQYDVIGAAVNNLGLKITFLDRKTS